MKAKPYPKYKSSGVKWLGDVPEHWDIKRARFMISMNPTKQEISHLSPEAEVSFLPMEAVGDDGTLKLEALRPISEVSSGYTYFAEGDVTFAKITPCFENGKGAIMRNLCTGYGFGTTELTVLRTDSKVNQEYLYYLTISSEFRKNGEAWMYGAGGQKRVPDDFVKEFRFSWPPLPEQEAIAAFLDRETQGIDTLVAKKKRLVELLREKRTALISHAVTRGLDPSVKLKPSGVQWLGDVPEHWEVVRLGRRIELQRGIDITKDEQKEGPVPVVSSGGIASYHNDPLVSGPGVVVGRKGTAGAIYYVECDYWPHDTTLYVKEFRGNHPRFVFYKLSSMDLASFDTGTANPTINRNLVHPVLVSWPPLSEQQAIAVYLDRETGRLDALIGKVEAAIEKLAEYRTALISAAVTGKIKVEGVN